MKMPEPIKTYPKSKNGPAISIYSAEQIKQYGRDLLEAAIEVDWTEVMREGGLVTWGDADTLGDRVIEKLRKMKEKL
jgi:hypothetical protein